MDEEFEDQIDDGCLHENMVQTDDGPVCDDCGFNPELDEPEEVAD